MHFDFTVTIGQLAVFVTLVGAIWRFNRLLTLFAIEHEILVEDYIERKRKDNPSYGFPTRGDRVRKWWRN